MTVVVDHAKLSLAARKLEELANTIEAQKNRATSGTPVELPTLGTSPLGPKLRWMRDEKPKLEGLADIALLLDTDGNGSSEFSVGADIADIKDMLGRTLADQRGQANPYDPESYERYAELFSRWADDKKVMSNFYETLGAEDSLRFLSSLAMDDQGQGLARDVQQQMLDDMRRGLETATTDPGFPDTRFAAALVKEAIIDPEDLFGRGNYNPSGGLAFLLYDGKFDRPFLETVSSELDQYERVDNNGAPGLWGNRPDQGVMFDQFMPYGSGANAYGNLDPMISVMSALKNDPEAALDFFSDGSHTEEIPARSYYYIHDRNWNGDGYNAISDVLDVATTNGELISDPTSDEATAAAFLASRTVDYLSERDNIDDLAEKLDWPGNGASENFAHIMSTYLGGVDVALRIGAESDVNPGTMSLYSDVFGGTNSNVPLFDEDSLKKFSLLAMSTDDGFAEVRIGLNEYRAGKVGILADSVAADNSVANIENLRDGIWQDANLEGFFIKQIGDDEIHEGAEADARIAAWVDGASGIVDLVPVPGVSKLGEGIAADLITMTVDHAKGSGTDAIKEALANNEDGARRNSEELANDTLNQQSYLLAQLLDDRDLSANPDGMSEQARPNGSMIDWDTYQGLNDAQKGEVLSQLYSNDLGVGQYFDIEKYQLDYKNSFLSYFD